MWMNACLFAVESFVLLVMVLSQLFSWTSVSSSTWVTRLWSITILWTLSQIFCSQAYGCIKWMKSPITLNLFPPRWWSGGCRLGEINCELLQATTWKNFFTLIRGVPVLSTHSRHFLFLPKTFLILAAAADGKRWYNSYASFLLEPERWRSACPSPPMMMLRSDTGNTPRNTHQETRQDAHHDDTAKKRSSDVSIWF